MLRMAIRLILTVLEAAMDIDVKNLKLIGIRGFTIAVVGSILPISIGISLAYGMGFEGKAAIGAGATFGPTSMGIALNVLKNGGISSTPLGQLIVSAAIVDDMLALVILSQLEALTGEITVVGVVVPILSAFLFLLLGGYIALFVLPNIREKYLISKIPSEHRDEAQLIILFGILLAMVPATFYAQASYLMGGFVTGLAFCSAEGTHQLFISQFKRVTTWCMRMFFAASIGFQVPVRDFGDVQVLWRGMVFFSSLFGKLAVGFLVPNMHESRNFTGPHLRDCLITGFSMASEGEFAFVIAVFAVDNGLTDRGLYASVVLAVLLSEIIPPFLCDTRLPSMKFQKQNQRLDIVAMSNQRTHWKLCRILSTIIVRDNKSYSSRDCYIGNAYIQQNFESTAILVWE
jgi:Kef-type K+ transport system membrane component KefB